MNKKAAQDLIEKTFNEAFNEERFAYFVSNLLNDIESKNNSYSGNLIWDDFKDHISSYKRIGKYTDPEGDVLDVLVVQVKTVEKLDRARTALRNFVIKHLSKFDKDYALVAFYSKEDEGADWRFSFVKLEYTSEMKEGKVKLKKEFTPAKRFSFLVGEHEKAHTAKTQLLPLLQNIQNNPVIRMSKDNDGSIEDAFSIEKVTDEFFEQYKELYIKLYEHFQNHTSLKNELEKSGTDTIRFTKKLLGQIVFLYFLLKKGWLGVPKNEHWGKGNKRFIQNLFDKAEQEEVNFFKDKLQFLFYEALAQKREDKNSYYERFDCRIPFLNGGLFEAEYDWKNANISIPKDLFRNDEKNKAGDIGTGILDVFDRYNFTIKEDEPLDKEVAVDPEMLGKVFENMLEITERKSKGAFYTPREIVHYMCQESLIHYLDNALNEKINKEDIEIFIREGHNFKDNDERVAAKGETKTYQYQLPESIRQNADLIDEKLSDIKICDPAIGSGAFPVGLLHELVNTMLVLKPHLSYDYFTEKLKGFGFEHRESINESRYIYRLKRHIIQESIYGVDIDAAAIDIARLRLWLSLVVDEDDLDPIETLPNLDYKIVCGNSLIGLPDDAMRDLKVEAELEVLKDQFYNLTDSEKKKALRQKINAKIRELLDSAEQFAGYKIDFDFRLFLSEVWREKGGFDVVIGNPPYVEAKKLKHISHLLKSYGVYSGTADLSVYFIEKGNKLIKKNGFLTYITTNKFFNTGYGKLVRKFLLQKKITHIINFEQVEVFEKVLVSSVIIGLQNSNPYNKKTIYEKFEKLKHLQFKKEFTQKIGNFDSYKQTLLDEAEWSFPDEKSLKIKNIIEKEGTQVGKLKGVSVYRGVTTGYNPAFIINSEIRDDLIKKDPKNSEVIKPLLQGRNIRKWKYHYVNQFLIFTKQGLDIKQYPLVEEYLRNYYVELKPRNGNEKTGRKPGTYKWFEIQDNTAYYPEFEKSEKLIWGLTADKWAFAYDAKQHYLPSNGYILTSEEIPVKYLLGILNSEVMNYYFGFIGVMTAGGAYTLKHTTIQHLPIVIAKDQKTLIEIVDYVLILSKSGKNIILQFFEEVINSIIYELYFPSELKSAGKEIIKHLGDLKPITPLRPVGASPKGEELMSEEEKLAIIQSEFERLYDPNHPVRNAIETLDSVEEVRIIKEALK